MNKRVKTVKAKLPPYLLFLFTTKHPVVLTKEVVPFFCTWFYTSQIILFIIFFIKVKLPFWLRASSPDFEKYFDKK